MTQPRPDTFDAFVADISALLAEATDEADILARGGALLADLVAQDGWLPDAYATSGERGYTQYLLYRDPDARFSVVSFVWGPGQGTPVHDHTVWGLVGVLRGAELCQAYDRDGGGLRAIGPAERLGTGEVAEVSPRIGDIHQVSNALDDRPSVSIHVYGGDIGAIRRSTFDPTGAAKPFVSGYADLPPLRASLQESPA
jgi:predicted metal-dependent enzyme (double-stranded beta helix superfamily)